MRPAVGVNALLVPARVGRGKECTVTGERTLSLGLESQDGTMRGLWESRSIPNGCC